MVQSQTHGDVEHVIQDVSILELANMIRDRTGFEGELEFNRSMPDGTPRKLLAIPRMKSFGWSPSICLQEGLRGIYEWFMQSENQLRT